MYCNGKLYGISSFGPPGGCGDSQRVGVYSSIPAHADFIRKTLGRICNVPSLEFAYKIFILFIFTEYEARKMRTSHFNRNYDKFQLKSLELFAEFAFHTLHESTFKIQSRISLMYLGLFKQVVVL